jgi:hypothetical protein
MQFSAYHILWARLSLVNDCDAQLYRRRAIFDAAQFGDARFHKTVLARLFFG